MNTPVAFIVFNRAECVRRTLAAIRLARPPRLLIIADGPRDSRPDDPAKCAAVRKLVEEGVDWPCEIERNYATRNLGCAERLASGLTWAFSRSERLIVIEDDCLPDPSFFGFCEELLERYANDTRVGQISGCPMFFSEIDRASSYIFSRYGSIWGWASWRRAWNYYDLKIESWPRFSQGGGLDAVVHSQAEYKKRKRLYSEMHGAQVFDSWDYQWGYAKFSQGLLSVVPCRNLIENTGYGPDGTHYGPEDKFTLKRFSMERPLRHPEFVIPDLRFDRAFGAADTKNMFGPPLWERALRKVKRLFATIAGSGAPGRGSQGLHPAEDPILASNDSNRL